MSKKKHKKKVGEKKKEEGRYKLCKLKEKKKNWNNIA